MAEEKSDRVHYMLATHEDGTQEPAEFLHRADEPCPGHRVENFKGNEYINWRDSNGVLQVARSNSAFVGASKQYSANYESMDWGN